MAIYPLVQPGDSLPWPACLPAALVRLVVMCFPPRPPRCFCCWAGNISGLRKMAALACLPISSLDLWAALATSLTYPSVGSIAVLRDLCRWGNNRHSDTTGRYLGGLRQQRAWQQHWYRRRRPRQSGARHALATDGSPAGRLPLLKGLPHHMQRCTDTRRGGTVSRTEHTAGREKEGRRAHHCAARTASVPALGHFLPVGL